MKHRSTVFGVALAAAVAGIGLTATGAFGTGLPSVARTGGLQAAAHVRVEAKKKDGGKVNAHHHATHAKAIATKSGFPLRIKDDVGRWITIKKQPTRILSLTLGTDEMLLSLVSPSHILGMDYLANDPTYSNVAARVNALVAHHQLKLVGSESHGLPNVETLIAMRPDLVLIADYTNQNIVRQLQNAGIPVFEFATFNNIRQIEQHALVLGRLVGAEARAHALVDKMNAQLAALAKTAPKKKLSVLVDDYGYVDGRNTTYNSVIVHAGGVNAASSIATWAQLGIEGVAKLNPDIIIIPDDSGAQDLQLKAFLKEPGVKALRAVRDHHVYTVSDAQLSDVAQYIVDGVRDVQHVLIEAEHSPHRR
ncbi:MAG: ABC transporter substrate-binding protein, partial [Firmicutes bacterium]|nr:ABC transporter substrate-binding protein [Bacillota bacterium]